MPQLATIAAIGGLFSSAVGIGSTIAQMNKKKQGVPDNALDIKANVDLPAYLSNMNHGYNLGNFNQGGGQFSNDFKIGGF